MITSRSPEPAVRARPRPGPMALECVVGCVLGWALALAPCSAAQSVAPQLPAEGHPPAVTPSPISLDRAVAQAEQHFKARVVRANEEEVEGHHVYVLRLLSEEGRVWTVRVDAQTGVMN